MNRRQMMKSILSALALLDYVRLDSASASSMGGMMGGMMGNGQTRRGCGR